MENEFKKVETQNTTDDITKESNPCQSDIEQPSPRSNNGNQITSSDILEQKANKINEKNLPSINSSKTTIGIVSIVVSFLVFFSAINDSMENEYSDFTSSFVLSVFMLYIGIITLIIRKKTDKSSFIIPSVLYIISSLITCTIMNKYSNLGFISILPILFAIWLLFNIFLFNKLSVPKSERNKNTITLILITTLLFAIYQLISGSTTAKTIAATISEARITTNAVILYGEDASDKEIESDGGAEVDTENIIITIPAKYTEGTTQEELDQNCNDGGFLSYALNDDGSVTYVMNEAQHAEFLKVTVKMLTDELNSWVGSSDFPNITSIEINNYFTEFKITTTSTELSMSESLSYALFFMCGDMYNICNQTETNNITVNYINADTEEIIKTYNSSEME